MHQRKSKKILIYFFLFLIIGSLNNKNLINVNFAKINEIYIIPTSRLIHFLKIDKERAEKCIEFYKQVPRGLNMQASAYKKDLKAIASKVIEF